MAGVAGFEPTSARVKVSCLTAWLHPKASLIRKMGWIVGLEPTTSRATIWHSSQLNYIHHASYQARRCILGRSSPDSKRRLARPQGFEPGTYGLEGRCSILLSYRRTRVPKSYFNRLYPFCQAVFSRPDYFPQHFLYFLPLPQGQGSFLPTVGSATYIFEARYCCKISARFC